MNNCVILNAQHVRIIYNYKKTPKKNYLKLMQLCGSLRCAGLII